MTTQPRCFTHRAAEELPRGCDTCQRIDLERDIVTRTVDALLAAGRTLAVTDGDAHMRPSQATTDRAAILAALMETDDDLLLAYTTALPLRSGWVRFVYGNDGWDVINDYSTSLEDLLAPVNAYADQMGGA